MLHNRVEWQETKEFTLWFFMVLSNWGLPLEGKEWIHDSILLTSVSASVQWSPSASTWDPQLVLSVS